MATTTPTHISQAQQQHQQQPSEFELRRSALIGEISESLEQVLTQLNGLNRNLEGIIEIGNEFASVEALWSQFETVMGKNAAGAGGPEGQDEVEKDRDKNEDGNENRGS